MDEVKNREMKSQFIVCMLTERHQRFATEPPQPCRAKAGSGKGEK